MGDPAELKAPSSDLMTGVEGQRQRGRVGTDGLQRPSLGEGRRTGCWEQPETFILKVRRLGGEGALNA